MATARNTNRGANAPDYQMTVDGKDITPMVDARLISLDLTEGRGDEADQLTITLDDSDGKLAIPPQGAKITLLLGWVGQALVDKGEFEVDEIEHGGTPDQLTITARPVEMRGRIRLRDSGSWAGATLGKVVGDIAARNGLQPKVAPDLASRALGHIDQTNESDLHFISRVARQHDATATVKKGRLIVLPIGTSTTADGQALPQLTIARRDGDSHRWHSAERNGYTGAQASWYDQRAAKRKEVTAGDAANAKRLKDVYATEADATAAVNAERGRIERGKATFEITLATGRPELMPQATVTVNGFKPQIDSARWRIVKCTHSVGDGGYTTRIELELAA